MTKKVKTFFCSAFAACLIALCACVLAFGAPTVTACASNGADAFFISDGGTKFQQGVSAPEYSVGGEGVLVKASRSNSVVRVKNAVDVSGGMKKIIDFMPIASERGKNDFTDFTVTLTDTKDSSKYIIIFFYANGWWEKGKYGSLVSVKTNMFSRRAYKYGDSYDTFDSYDTVVELSDMSWLSMNGLNGEDEANRYRPFSVWYDSEKAIVSILNHNGVRKTVLNLRDADAVGNGNEWTGFFENRAYLSFSASNIVGGNAAYLVTDVCGQPLSGAVADTTAPSLFADIDKGEILVAKTGKEYELPAADAVDMFDGLVPVKRELISSGKEPIVLGDKFTPTAAGTYTLKLSAQDGAGNIVEKEWDFLVLDNPSAPAVSFGDTSGLNGKKAGERVFLPSFVTDATRRTTTETELLRITDGRKITVSGDSFLPTLAGKYAYTVFATDRAGLRSFDRAVFEVAKSDNGLIKECDAYLPEAFIDGVSVVLPRIPVYDVQSVSGGRIFASQTVKVCGTGEKKAVIEDAPDFRFTPSREKFGDSVSLEYTVYGKGGNITENYIVPIREEPKQIDGYFALDGFAVSYEKLENLTAADMIFGADGSRENAKASFLIPLSARNASFEFRINAAKNKFGAMKMTFVDSVNAAQKLTVVLTARADRNLTSVLCGGKAFSMSGSLEGKTFSANETPLKLTYNNANRALSDRNGNTVCVVEKYDDGSAFAGFGSGSVYVAAEIEDISGETEITVVRIGNQALYGTYKSSAQGESLMTDFEDYMPPVIEYMSEIEMYTEKGFTNTLPAARGFDELSGELDVFVSVTSPSGAVVLEKTSAAVPHGFSVVEKGIYQVVYTTRDRVGNITTQTYSVRIGDTSAPTVFLSSYGDIECEAGKSVKLPYAVAQDNLTQNPTLRILVYGPSSDPISADGGEFVPPAKGKYIVRYCAFDEEGNTTVKEVRLTAK